MKKINHNKLVEIMAEMLIEEYSSFIPDCGGDFSEDCWSGEQSSCKQRHICKHKTLMSHYAKALNKHYYQGGK